MTKKKNKDDEITLVVPPPVPINYSDITTCYNLGDPLLLEQSIDKAINNYKIVTKTTNELREILIILLSDKYNVFQKDAPRNPWEMKNFLNKIINDNVQTLSEFNKINHRRNELLNKLNNCDSTNDDLEAILDVYSKIKNDNNHRGSAHKIKQFLSDIQVALLHSEHFIKDESINIVYDSIKEFKTHKDSIEKINKMIERYEKEGLTKEPEYFFAKELLYDLTPNTTTTPTIVVKPNVKVKNKRLNELLDFIKNNPNYDTSTMKLEDYEKYNILSSHLNLKNICITCLHKSSGVRNIEDTLILVTEDALKGKQLNFKGLVKLFEKEKVPFISYEKLILNKKNIEEALEKLNISCYAQSKIYEKENSWKYKLKLFVATASLISMGVVGYTNDAHVHTYELIKNQSNMTSKLYEEKKDAIKKMENDVLNSISGRTHKIDNFTYKQIKKIKDKKNRMKYKTKKIIETIKN